MSATCRHPEWIIAPLGRRRRNVGCRTTRVEKPLASVSVSVVNLRTARTHRAIAPGSDARETNADGEEDEGARESRLRVQAEEVDAKEADVIRVDGVNGGNSSSNTAVGDARGKEETRRERGESTTSRWAKVDVGGALAAFGKKKASPGGTLKKDGKRGEVKSSIKVTDKDKVIQEWGDSLSWDSSRVDGTALDGRVAPSPDLFDAILGQTAMDVDELERVERARRAKRLAKALEKRRKRKEQQLRDEKRVQKARAKELAKKRGSTFVSGEWEDAFDEENGLEEEEVDNVKSIRETLSQVMESDVAKWMFNFFIVPTVIAKVVEFSIISPIVSEELKLAGQDRTTIELREDQEVDILEKLHRYERKIEFETIMGRQAPLTTIEKQDLLHKEAERLEALEIQRAIDVEGNRYSDLVFISAFLIMVVVYSDQAKLVVTGTKNAFFALEPAQQAFILLLSSDVLVGYHSADAWQTVLRSIGGHYGIPEEENLISLFVAFVPVSVDVLFKFWVFKYLRRMAPSTQVILDDIDRH
jgi:hypothetical protein